MTWQTSAWRALWRRGAGPCPAGQLTGADQVYNCLWSHLAGKPGHIHYVVQPVTRVQTAAYEAFGIGLQVAMSLVGDFPDEAEVARLAERARELFALGPPPDGLS